MFRYELSRPEFRLTHLRRIFQCFDRAFCYNSTAARCQLTTNIIKGCFILLINKQNVFFCRFGTVRFFAKFLAYNERWPAVNIAYKGSCCTFKTHHFVLRENSEYWEVPFIDCTASSVSLFIRYSNRESCYGFRQQSLCIIFRLYLIIPKIFKTLSK